MGAYKFHRPKFLTLQNIGIYTWTSNADNWHMGRATRLLPAAGNMASICVQNLATVLVDFFRTERSLRKDCKESWNKLRSSSQ